jgi:SMC interacting uncharacterized protein involved in chromosome segregation
MGAGRKELVKVVAEKDAATDAFRLAADQARATIGAAESFAKSCAKTLPKFVEVEVHMCAAVEECRRFAEKIDECEERHAEAKKAKDKDRMKELEKEMKGLMQDFQERYQYLQASIGNGEEVVKEIAGQVNVLKGVIR